MARIRTHTNPFNHRNRLDKIDFKEISSDFQGRFDVEIGCGRGLFLRNYARKFPDRSIIGVDIRKQIIDLLRSRVGALALKNVYLVHSRGDFCLEDLIDDGSLGRLFIFHPDPWLKRRHHNRRIVNDSFLRIVQQKLAHEGRVYVATDVKSLWDEMKSLMVKYFTEIPDDEFWDVDYQSHWNDYSKEDGRNRFHATFVRKSIS